MRREIRAVHLTREQELRGLRVAVQGLLAGRGRDELLGLLLDGLLDGAGLNEAGNEINNLNPYSYIC